MHGHTLTTGDEPEDLVAGHRGAALGELDEDVGRPADEHAGVALLANAHVVIASQGSSFGLTDIREGRCHPALWNAVAAAIGERRTRELALTGRVFSTPEALAWGLVHAATPAFELDDRAASTAAALAEADPQAVRLAMGLNSHPED